MKNNKSGLVLVLALVVTPGLVLADSQEPLGAEKPYVGIALGFSYSSDLLANVRDVVSSAGIGGEAKGRQGEFAGGVYLGEAFGKHVEARLGYAYLGRYSVDATLGSGGKLSTSVTWTALSAEVLLKAPVADGSELYVKLGYAATRAKETVSGTAGYSDSDSETKSLFVPGVGLKMNLNDRTSASFEVNYYSKLAGSGDGYDFSMTTFTGGVQYRF